MKLSLAIAIAILPCLAVGAQAHSGHHRYGGHHFQNHHGGLHGRFRHRQAEARVPHDRSATPSEGRSTIFAMVTRSAIEHGLPPALAHGIVRVESGYRCSAYNAGATGIMQIKPATAQSVGISGGLQSCARGLEAGMRYLRQAYVMAHGNAAFAATLYNRGLGAHPSQSGYSRSVMRMSAL